ncbi:MAG: ubiquinone/menaquinone biosynthesis C-methylase UbiE, partial [Myxococcota bacterium]
RFNDVARWSAVFDSPERDAWQRPEALIAAIDIPVGAAVADIGAGTGYFLPHLAAAVGGEGTVYAVDVESSLINHMTRRALSAGLMQVKPILGTFDDAHLPEGSVDRVLMVNTYHHVAEREDYFRRLQGAMRPGGQLIVVDFTLDTERGPPVSHRLAPDVVTAELGAAGWTAAGAVDVLPDQYVLIFEQSGQDR